MIILDATTESLMVTLAVAIITNQLQYTVTYVDVTSSTYSPSSNDGSTTSTSDVTIVSSPASAATRHIKQLSVYNADTVAATVTIKKDTSGVQKTLCKITLGINEVLNYNDGTGFFVTAVDGSQKVGSLAPPAIVAGTQTGISGNQIFSNANGLSFGITDSCVTASVSRLSMNYYEVWNGELETEVHQETNVVGNMSMQAINMPYDMTVTRLDVIAAMSLNGSTTGSWAISCAIYTRNRSTLYLSGTVTSGLTWGSGGATTDTGSYNGVSGTRIRSFAPQSWILTAGEYWFGFMAHTTGAAGSPPGLRYYGFGGSQISIPGGGLDTVGNYGGYMGSLTAAFPPSMAFNEIFWNNSNQLRQWYFRLYGT